MNDSRTRNAGAAVGTSLYSSDLRDVMSIVVEVPNEQRLMRSRAQESSRTLKQDMLGGNIIQSSTCRQPHCAGS